MAEKKVYIQVYNKIILGKKVFKPTFKRLTNGKIVDGEPIEVTEEEAKAIGRHCKIVAAPKKAKKEKEPEKSEPEPDLEKDEGPSEDQKPPEKEPESKEKPKEKPKAGNAAPKRGGKGKK